MLYIHAFSHATRLPSLASVIVMLPSYSCLRVNACKVGLIRTSKLSRNMAKVGIINGVTQGPNTCSNKEFTTILSCRKKESTKESERDRNVRNNIEGSIWKLDFLTWFPNSNCNQFSFLCDPNRLFHTFFILLLSCFVFVNSTLSLILTGRHLILLRPRYQITLPSN